MTDLTEQASHRIGWLAPIIDERNAALDSLEPEHLESLHDVASTLDRIGHDVRRLASRVRGLELSHDDNITGTVRATLPHIGRSAANPGIGM